MAPSMNRGPCGSSRTRPAQTRKSRARQHHCAQRSRRADDRIGLRGHARAARRRTKQEPTARLERQPVPSLASRPSSTNPTIQAGSATSRMLVAGSSSSSTGTPTGTATPGSRCSRPLTCFSGAWRSSPTTDSALSTPPTQLTRSASCAEGRPCACRQPRWPSTPSTRALPCRASQTRSTPLSPRRRPPQARSHQRHRPPVLPGVRPTPHLDSPVCS